MSDYILWILLLSLWNVILFYGKSFGLSVILFMVPLSYFMYYFLKKNNKIKNKKGLLYFIPIILLSLSYFIFDNELFSVLNVPVIVGLFILMYIFTTNPIYNLNILSNDFFSLLFNPFNYISRLFRITKYKIGNIFHISDKSKKILKTIVIVVPATLIVVGLLSSADMVFGKIFNTFFDKLFDIIEDLLLDHLIARIICFVLVFFAIGCTCMYLLYDYKNLEVKNNSKGVKDQLTIKTLITVLNIIYVIFDYIQIKSLILHKVSSSIDYARYAREGFFELMLVTFINVMIILISKAFENKKNDKENRYVKVMNVIMIFLTTIIVASSFLRMHMYEAQFGYTTSRVLVFAILITESILLIPTVMYIFNSEVNIVRSFLIIIISAYVITNYCNIDYMVARRNVNRYYANKKLDVDYLKNYHTDNIPVLLDLYNKTDDNDIKDNLDYYFKAVKENILEEKSVFEFNLSKIKAEKQITKRFNDYSVNE